MRKSDVAIAKNHLHPDELHALISIVAAYLEFADVPAPNGQPAHEKTAVAAP